MLLAGCSREETLFHIGKAEAIEIQLGQTGQKLVIADKAFIDYMTSNINSLKYVKTSACEDETAIGEIVISEENGYQIHYGGFCYKVADDLNIDTNRIAEELDIGLSSSPAPENAN